MNIQNIKIFGALRAQSPIWWYFVQSAPKKIAIFLTFAPPIRNLDRRPCRRGVLNDWHRLTASSGLPVEGFRARYDPGEGQHVEHQDLDVAAEQRQSDHREFDVDVEGSEVLAGGEVENEEGDDGDHRWHESD